MAERLIQATIADLGAHAPFDRMEAPALRFLAAHLSIAYFAKGSEVTGPSAGDADCLYIVKKGAVVGESPGVSTGKRAGVEVSLGAGECFPLAAMAARRASGYRYRTLEDSFLYRLEAHWFHHLLEISARFQAHCTAYLASLVERSEREMQALVGESLAETRSMLEPLTRLVSRAPVSCATGTPLREVLNTMSEQGVGSMVVVDSQNFPVGIFTQPDVLKRVALAEVDLSTAVDAVMTTQPITLAADAPAFEAALAMARHSIRHVVLVSDGRLAGVVSERDLFAMQRLSLRRLAERVRGGANVEALSEAAADIRQLVRSLVAQGFGAAQVTQIVSTLNDSLTARLIHIAASRHELRGRWCWIALGSEGRAEQTLSTDQDNALILMPAERTEPARDCFLAFADEVNRALDVCGFPLCKGDIMARNPQWCMTLDDWRTAFSNWIRNYEPRALLNAAIFFDFRAIAGDGALAGELRQWVLEKAAASPAFLRAMAENALQVRPPLGLLRDFVTDGSAEFPDTIDLKARGIRPFVDAARVYALAHRLSQTGTAARLHMAGEAGALPRPEAAAAIEAFNFLQMLRIRHQFLQARLRPGSENRIAPDSVNALDRRILKAAFRQAVMLQERLGLDYQL